MDLLPVSKKVVNALGPANYNVIQNNGRIAHQMVYLIGITLTKISKVDHVHFHIIPCDDKGGLGLKWDSISPPQEELLKVKEDILAKLENL